MKLLNNCNTQHSYFKVELDQPSKIFSPPMLSLMGASWCSVSPSVCLKQQSDLENLQWNLNLNANFTTKMLVILFYSKIIAIFFWHQVCYGPDKDSPGRIVSHVASHLLYILWYEALKVSGRYNKLLPICSEFSGLEAVYVNVLRWPISPIHTYRNKTLDCQHSIC